MPAWQNRQMHYECDIVKMSLSHSTQKKYVFVFLIDPAIIFISAFQSPGYIFGFPIHVLCILGLIDWSFLMPIKTHLN